MRRLIVAMTLALAAPGPVEAQGPGRTFVLLVSGVSGEKRFADSFHALSMTLYSAARGQFAIPDSHVVYLAEDSTRDVRVISGRSTRVNVERVLGGMVAKVQAGDRLMVVLFGHGSSLGGTSRFNLPGPDMSDADFARILQPLTAPQVVFINTASASGDYAKSLAGPNRIVVTATKSAREQNETIFPTYFVQGLTTSSGDADKDGRVSLLEAFIFASKEVDKAFETTGRLASEHPQLEDDGDGVAHPKPGDVGADGNRARAFFLEPLGGARLAADPRAAQLLADRRLIESRIDSLRTRRNVMTEDAYQRILEPLMVELAEKSQALRALSSKQP